MTNLRANNLTGTGGRNAIDGSLYFRGYVDGTYLEDYLKIPDSDDLDIGTGDFTFEAWVKPVEHNGTNSPNYMSIFSAWTYHTGMMQIQVKNDGKFRCNNNGTIDATGTTILWGNWHHIAFARSGSTIKGFVNGIEEISFSFSSAIDFAYGGAAVIGASSVGNYPGDYPFRGYISNLRLIKGSALYTASFTPPTEKLTAVAGTVLLCCQDSNDATQEATGRTITAHGGWLPTSRDTNIIQNGTFDGTTNWFGDSSAAISASGNVATVTNGGGDNLYAIAQRNVCRIGGKYRIRGTVNATFSGDSIFRVRAGGSAVSWSITNVLTSGTAYDFDTGEVTADGTTLEIGSGGDGSSSTITQFTLQNVVVNAIDPPKQTNELPPVGVDEGVTFGGETKHNSQGYMYFPTGDTSQRSRGRAVWGGGTTAPTSMNATIDYISIDVGGIAQDFGDLTANRNEVRAFSSTTRGVFGGGRYPHPSVTNIIDYVTLSTTANATDFGDLTDERAGCAAVSNNTRGVFIAGFDPSNSNIMDYVTIPSTGNATDFGDTVSTYQAQGRAMSPTRGLAAGNYGASNLIEYITIATTGNSTDFGDMTVAGYSLTGTSSNTRGIFAGGEPGRTNVMDYVTIASTGNAADFGDLYQAVTASPAATSNSVRGVVGGGQISPALTNVIQMLTIATLGDTVRFGDLSVARAQLSATSDSHGGL